MLRSSGRGVADSVRGGESSGKGKASESSGKGKASDTKVTIARVRIKAALPKSLAISLLIPMETSTVLMACLLGQLTMAVPAVILPGESTNRISYLMTE